MRLGRLERTVVLFVIVGLLFLGLLYVQGQTGTSINSLVLRTILAQGYTDVHVNWTPAGMVCESGEQGYRFTALNQQQVHVSGIVCARTTPAAYAYIRYK